MMGSSESAEGYRALGAALLNDEGVRGLVARLARAVGVPVALIDLRGNMISLSPSRESWPVEELRSRRQGDGSNDESPDIVVLDIEADREVVALLCVRSGASDVELVRFGAGLIAQDVARRQAEASGRREQAEQVLDDAFSGGLSEQEGTRRLLRLGIDVSVPQRVLVGTSTAGRRRVKNSPWNLHALLAGHPEQFVRAVLGDAVVIVVPDGPAVDTVARSLQRHLADLGSAPRVGVGGSYVGLAGFRLSYLEARDASLGAVGINAASSLDLSRLLLVADLRLPLRDLAERALGPLIAHDAEHAARLVDTLRVWLEAECSVSDAAAALFVHKNTVRYRLGLVEKLTACDLQAFSWRMHWWFALSCLSVDSTEGRS